MINQFLRVTGTHETMLVFANLINVTLRGPQVIYKLKSGQRQDGREKKTIWTLCGERLMQHVDLEKPQSSWNTCIGIEKLPGLGDSSENIAAWFHDMDGHAKNMRRKKMTACSDEMEGQAKK